MGSDPSMPSPERVDVAALDALVDSGFDASRVSAEHQATAGRIASFMSMLGQGGPKVDPLLVDATMARVRRAGVTEAQLSPQDQSALESWVMSGYQSSRVPGSLRARARKHEALAAHAMHVPGVEASARLVERTLDRVQAEADAQDARMMLETARTGRGGIRLADLVSVAAVLLIGTAVVWPVLSAVRHEARKTACMANMGSTGLAFGQYASSHRDSLPMATASLNGGPWWNVGAPDRQSNSANLYELTRTGYASLADLACPGNPKAPREGLGAEAGDWRSFEEVSYSYQIMFGPARITWSAPVRGVVIADRSPVVARAMRGEWFSPDENSPNHNGHGQHILFSDGSSEWRRTPELASKDNIWLPRVLEQAIDAATGRRDREHLYQLHGTETPTSADDAFVGP